MKDSQQPDVFPAGVLQAMTDAARQIDARTGLELRIAAISPKASLALNNVYGFFIGMVMLRRASRRFDAHKLSNALRSEIRSNQQPKRAIPGCDRLLLGFTN